MWIFILCTITVSDRAGLNLPCGVEIKFSDDLLRMHPVQDKNIPEQQLLCSALLGDMKKETDFENARQPSSFGQMLNKDLILDAELQSFARGPSKENKGFYFKWYCG